MLQTDYWDIYLIKPGKFEEPMIAFYVHQVLESLKYLHEQGVVHRDI